MRRARAAQPDLATCYPERAVGYETEGELVVVLRPRFMSGPLARWLQPRLRRPYFHVRLDALGSFVWNHCDGQTTVSQIADELQRHFGEKERAVMERVVRFLRELHRGGMVRLRLPSESEALS